MYWGVGAEIVRIFASGDENDLADSREIGRSSSIRLVLRLAMCHLRTKIAARRKVHVEAITTRTIVAVKTWVWLGPRLLNDCLMRQIEGG